MAGPDLGRFVEVLGIFIVKLLGICVSDNGIRIQRLHQGFLLHLCPNLSFDVFQGHAHLGNFFFNVLYGLISLSGDFFDFLDNLFIGYRSDIVFFYLLAQKDLFDLPIYYALANLLLHGVWQFRSGGHPFFLHFDHLCDFIRNLFLGDFLTINRYDNSL